MIMPLSGPWAMVLSHRQTSGQDRRKVCRYRLHGGVSLHSHIAVELGKWVADTVFLAPLPR